jgi:hypothetical protein
MLPDLEKPNGWYCVHLLDCSQNETNYPFAFLSDTARAHLAMAQYFYMERMKELKATVESQEQQFRYACIIKQARLFEIVADSSRNFLVCVVPCGCTLIVRDAWTGSSPHEDD